MQLGIHSPGAISSAILDSLIEEVAIVDASGTIVQVNEAWRRFAEQDGAAPATVLEGADYLSTLRAGASDAGTARILAGIEAILDGSQDFFEHECAYRRNGEPRWFVARASRLRGPTGGAVITHIDITDRKIVERERESHRFELGRAVRAATLGQLSGALAHELNQPLTAILANAEVGAALVQRDERPEDLAEVLHDIARDARRAGQVIGRMRSMLRGESKRFEFLNLNRIIDETLTLCNSELIARKIEVAREFQPRLPRLWGDPIGLQHVLLNLIVNAYESMVGVPVAQRSLRIVTGADPPGFITITVVDTGTGIDPAAREKVFEPLYTTKKTGLGLGLSICRSIVKAHDGDIAIAAAIVGGTEVTVRLPLGPGPSA